MGALVGLTGASLLVTLLRRGTVRRRLADRFPAALPAALVTALAAVKAPRSGARTATPAAPSSAEHDPRSADSA